MLKKLYSLRVNGQSITHDGEETWQADEVLGQTSSCLLLYLHDNLNDLEFKA